MTTSADPEIVVREKDVLRWALEREKVAPVTDPHDFYRHAHAVIWSAVLNAKASGLSPDYLTVKQILLERGQLEAVDPLYLHDLSRDSVRPSDTALASAATQIKEHAQQRRVKAMLGKLADETDINVIIATLETLKATSTHTPISKSLADVAVEIGDAPARRLLIGDLIARGEIAMFHGHPRSKKTWPALEFSAAGVTGTAACGLARLAVPQMIRVLYIGNEDSRGSIYGRVTGFLRGRGISSLPEGFRMIVGEGADLDDPKWQERIVNEVRDFNIDLVIIDPVRSVTARADGTPQDWKPVADYLRRLLRATNCAVLLVHHNTKPPASQQPENRRPAQRASGGGIFASVDAPMHVEAIDATRSCVQPDAFKHCADPEPFIFTLRAEGDVYRLTAEDSSATTADALALQHRIVGYLEQTPARAGTRSRGASRLERNSF